MSHLLSFLSVPLIATGAALHPATSLRTPDSGAVAPRDSSAMTLVVVQNNATAPVTVYAQNDVGEFKLGVVGAGDIGTLRVPDYVIAFDPTIDFFVKPKGGFTQDSGDLDLRRGEHIGLVIPHR